MATTRPIPLQEWIQRASSIASNIPSREKYLEHAVDVAHELTNCLCRIAGENGSIYLNHQSSFSSLNGSEKKGYDDADPSSSMMQVQLKDIVTENVLIHFVNNNNDPSDSELNNAIRSVDIRSSSGEDSGDINIFDIAQLSSRRDVCLALGRILFEVFSKGQLLLVIEREESDHNERLGYMIEMEDEADHNEGLDSNSQAFSFRDLSLGDDDVDVDDFFDDLLVVSGTAAESQDPANAVFPQAGKRSMSPSTSPASAAIAESSYKKSPAGKTNNVLVQSKPMKANIFLQEQCGLPLFICRLVSDLLEAGEGRDQFCADSAITSLDEARVNLLDMKAYPKRFLHDRVCPSKALEDTALFQQMTDAKFYGREMELSTLSKIAQRVASHVSSMSTYSTPRDCHITMQQTNQFMCEAAFISGRGGSGKSSCIKRLLSTCDTREWFVLSCKFDRQVAPLITITKCLNDFFEQFVDRIDNSSYERISQSIISSLDSEGIRMLYELMPVWSRLFPLSTRYAQQNSTSTGNVGSGRNRIHYLCYILVKSIFCGGHPVLIVLDDLQWSDSLPLDVISDVVQALAYQSAIPGSGLFILGSYRDNELDKNMLKQIQEIHLTGIVKVSELYIGELTKQDINKMLSFKLGMPMRYTRHLSELILQKTRGHPLFVQSFLQSIISRDMMSYSVKSRSWTWDDLTLELLDISEDVAEFLAQGISRLDKEVVDALKVFSCLGFQVNASVVQLLDLGQFVPSMTEALESAVKGGLLEKAGGLYVFSHDLLREAVYKLGVCSEIKSMHKTIGLSLALDPNVANDTELCTLAADQIAFCRDILSPMDRALFARLNLAAGKHAMASSSYEQARGYFEAGIELLHAKPWERQYDICLELYEMSVVVGFMDGEVGNVSRRLDAIFANAKSFEDTLTAHKLHIKVMASRGEYAESTTQCLSILSRLGEDFFPERIESAYVTNQITETEALMTDVTRSDIDELPVIVDILRLNVMRFLSMLCTFSMFYEPKLCQLSSCVMVKLTLKHGFCEESIHGLAAFSRALLLDRRLAKIGTGMVQSANRIGSLAESALIGRSNEHALRAKLTTLLSLVKTYAQPWQTVAEACENGFKSGMIVGDIESAMLCGQLSCTAKLCAGYDLKKIQFSSCNYFLRQMAKHNQVAMRIGMISTYNTCAAFTGMYDSSLGMKTNEELLNILKETQNTLLLYHVCMNQMSVHFYYREYIAVLDFAEQHKELLKTKRGGDHIRVFCVGLSSLAVARDTHAMKWRDLGEQMVGMMEELVQHSKWNFESKYFLLQAELHYLNGDLNAAEAAYKSSALSAREHRFNHEQALAHELYGIFLIDNKSVERGMEQLEMSLIKYKEWGADKKVTALISFMELIKTQL